MRARQATRLDVVHGTHRVGLFELFGQDGVEVVALELRVGTLHHADRPLEHVRVAQIPRHAAAVVVAMSRSAIFATLGKTPLGRPNASGIVAGLRLA